MMASCSDCAGPCEVGASDLASLRADLAAGARKGFARRLPSRRTGGGDDLQSHAGRRPGASG